MYHWLRTLLELLPLAVFALTWRLPETLEPDGWILPYSLGALCALACITVLLWRKVLLDRILLGMNLSIVLGALGLFGGTPGLPHLMADIRGAGFFVIILMTAGVTYLMRPAALLDMESVKRGASEPWDRYMLFATFAAFVLAFALRESPVLSAMLLGGLFVVRASLRQVAEQRA
ncbi:hypothetical protein dsx2_0196 [Desulfovibrio sp. X2]|uniref:hypothetical protein n=1 Tax=Desulfovibrio sp. X2 TaxID=941449 RepID=UPI000358AD17|nr:hypothetical protein [Desulfovibrio sp. X2]EPR42269.1 hypothetical protein dsx2_0196 [Desulfovibrio sp. X2]